LGLMQLGKDRTQVAPSLHPLSVGGIQQQRSQVWTLLHDFQHIRLVGQLWMRLSPVMGGANEGEVGGQDLEGGIADGGTDRLTGALGATRLDEDDGEGVEEV